MKTFSRTLPAVILSIAIVALSLVLFFKPVERAFGSVAQGSEYHSTTTAAIIFPSEALIQTGGGALGSVVVTGAAAGTINIYDATTSNITLRAPSMSSSSVLIATFPANAPANTYTFDRAVFNGLYVSILGVVPTTTITYR